MEMVILDLRFGRQTEDWYIQLVCIQGRITGSMLSMEEKYARDGEHVEHINEVKYLKTKVSEVFVTSAWPSLQYSTIPSASKHTL